MIDILSFAGTATTYRATHAFVAILTNSPQLQKRLQREVDEAIGEEVPRLADKEKMPYIEAVRFEIFPLLNIYFHTDVVIFKSFSLQTVYELLRYISHTPVLVPHATMKDTSLGGYPIPKGTQVYPVFIVHGSTKVCSDITVKIVSILLYEYKYTISINLALNLI